MSTSYIDLHLQPLGGTWREGSSGRILKDVDPYSGKVLLELQMATAEDLQQTYQTAADAQREWEARSPAQRAEVLLKAVDIFDARRDEIVDWIIRESGGTRIKAELEWMAARAITLESASFPSRVHGRIASSNIPGKENRIYREPLGVVGIISPWNFPLHLTQRSLAPALALGNAAVVKPASDTPVSGGLLLARIFQEAGLPEGVLGVLVGPGSEIGDLFVSHPHPFPHFLHRLILRRRAHRRFGQWRRPSEEGSAGTGRQQPLRGAGRRRPRARGRCRRIRQVSSSRSDLHGYQPHHRRGDGA
ncbi:putative aldehyde dehydrogenase [Pseudomonas aeruginosa]|nr:putative aldehyde dehydrogenase [Pseudomonas aeruginosa]